MQGGIAMCRMNFISGEFTSQNCFWCPPKTRNFSKFLTILKVFNAITCKRSVLQFLATFHWIQRTFCVLSTLLSWLKFFLDQTLWKHGKFLWRFWENWRLWGGNAEARPIWQQNWISRSIFRKNPCVNPLYLWKMHLSSTITQLGVFRQMSTVWSDANQPITFWGTQIFGLWASD